MAAAFALILLSAGGFALPAPPRSGDAGFVRFELPAPRQTDGLAAAPSARAAPLAELAELPPEGPAVTVPDPEQAPAVLALAAVPVAVQKGNYTKPIASRSRISGVIPLRFSLAGGASAGDAIEVDKPVTFAGSDAGRIPLRIDGNAHVFALGSKLAEIIARQSGEAAVPEGLERDYVSLDRLRALGIGVRYDAIRDRLVVEAPGV